MSLRSAPFAYAGVVLLVTACSGGSFESSRPGGASTADAGGLTGGAASGGAEPAGGGAPAGGAAPGSGGVLPPGSGGATAAGGGGTAGRGDAGAGGIPDAGLRDAAVDTGAGGGSIVLAEDYPQHCDFDTDCALVSEGDQCACPECNGAAVRADALEEWSRSVGAVRCEESAACAAVCEERLPACADGQCASRRPRTIVASEYDRTCLTDTDCHLIYVGEVCSLCRCATSAVNTGGLQKYQEDVGRVRCAPPPVDCDCAAPTVPYCDSSGSGGMGHCTVRF